MENSIQLSANSIRESRALTFDFLRCFETIVRGLAAAGALLLSTCGCAASAGGGLNADPAAQPRFEACDVEGMPAQTRCGTVVVPEDRANPAGRSISLYFNLVPGSDKTIGPLFLLSGGPGQGSAELAPLIVTSLRSIHSGDILFVDQRGTGRSNRLNCEGGFALISEEGISRIPPCVVALSKVADLRRYGTPEAVEDIEAVRAAFGYPRINLFGDSYGTRVAGAYMRAYPRRTRAAVLRAAASPDFNILQGGLGNADAELARVFEQCRRDATCGGAFPEVKRRYASLQTALESNPVTLRVRGADGTEQELRVTAASFNQAIYVLLLGARTRQQVPRFIFEASTRGLDTAAPILLQIKHSTLALPVGMYLSVVCSEDVARLDPRKARTRRIGLSADIAIVARLCDNWPKRRIPASQFSPLTVAVPTLLISGALDPSTTAQAAERFARSLARSRHLILPATSHGPLIPDCAVPAVAAFLRSASPNATQSDCSNLTLPQFAAPASAPPR